jgi:IS30 family transposase
MRAYIVSRLREDKWSPEIISQVAKRQGRPLISHEWIYQWIWECKHTDRHENRPYKTLYKYLRHHGRHRCKRGNQRDNRGLIPGRVGIEQRPALLKDRMRPGDIEIDLMLGKSHQGAVLVMTDRATLHTRLKLLPSKDSAHIAQSIIQCLIKNKYKTHTMTFDNDQAFRGHQQAAKALQADTYFTRPYTSQDKGTVENRIGVLRRFLPKPTDLTFVTAQQVRHIERKLNCRPVKKFNYQTPNQVLQEKIALIS